MRLIALLFSMLFAAGLSFAHDGPHGELIVLESVAYPTMGRSGAGYMVIKNMGEADRLIGVEASFPKVMIHNTVLEDGIAKMRHQMAVDIPAGGMVEFAPGGLHVMFMGVARPWMVGNEIGATLIFEKAGRLNVVFQVENRPVGEAAHSH